MTFSGHVCLRHPYLVPFLFSAIINPSSHLIFSRNVLFVIYLSFTASLHRHCIIKLIGEHTPYSLLSSLFASSLPPPPLPPPSPQMTSVNYWTCLVASVIGLFPTQFLNTYMGSTIRNMQEVLGDQADGYIILIAQVLFTIVLMFYLVRRARQELAVLTESSSDPPLNHDKDKSLA